MVFEKEQQIVAEIKQYITENLPLSKLSDEELQEKVEAITMEKLSGQYISIEQQVSIVEQVYSSIRGFGLLDSIISDDTITEVMINGPQNIFIEQNGRLFKLDEKDMHMVVMCGMSAVFSALFGTPITAAVFALGVTSVGIMYYSALVPCLMSSLAAFLVTRFAGLEPTQFAITVIPQTGVITILQTILISALCAELSIIFCTTMHYTARYLKIWFKNPYIRVVVGALAIIALTYLTGSRDYNGSGMDIIEHAVVGGHAKGWAWALKIVFTAITIGAGFKGGEIVPTFFIGATFGCVVGHLFGLNPGFAAAIGMIAMFCGVLNCPIASIVLSIELFGSKGFILFAIAAGVSYMLSGYYGLYSSQKIMYSKLKAEYINKDTK